MANLDEVSLYKNRLAMSFCTSNDVTSLLRIQGDEDMSPQDFMYERVFPYAHVPDASEIGRCFLCFEIDVPSVKSNVIKTVEIKIYIMSHQNILRLSDGRGLRTDVLSAVVDKMLNGSDEYGVGTVELMSWRSFSPITGYYGRELKYRVQDINRSLCSWGT